MHGFVPIQFADGNDARAGGGAFERRSLHREHSRRTGKRHRDGEPLRLTAFALLSSRGHPTNPAIGDYYFSATPLKNV